MSNNNTLRKAGTINGRTEPPTIIDLNASENQLQTVPTNDKHSNPSSPRSSITNIMNSNIPARTSTQSLAVPPIVLHPPQSQQTSPSHQQQQQAARHSSHSMQHHQLASSQPHLRLPRSQQQFQQMRSVPQTLTVSPVQLSNSNPNISTTNKSQPILNVIKQEHAPFRPPLPYVIDEDITIEKETDPKKKNQAMPIHDVDEAPTNIITHFI